MSGGEHERALGLRARELFGRVRWEGAGPEWALTARELFGAERSSRTPRARRRDTPQYGLSPATRPPAKR